MNDFVIPLLIASLVGNAALLKVVFDHIKHAIELTAKIHSLENEIWSLKSKLEEKDILTK